jgi:hypothetical protein
MAARELPRPIPNPGQETRNGKRIKIDCISGQQLVHQRSVESHKTVFEEGSQVGSTFDVKERGGRLIMIFVTGTAYITRQISFKGYH